MPLIVCTAEPLDSPAGRLLLALVEDLAAHRPGGFFLAAAPGEAPDDFDFETADWIGLPKDGDLWAGGSELAAAVVASVACRFGTELVVGVGNSAQDLLGDLPTAVDRVLVLLAGEEAGGPESENRINAEPHETLSARFRAIVDRHVPFQIQIGPETDQQTMLDRADRARAANSAAGVIVDWRRAPGPELNHLLARLCVATAPQVVLRLVASDLFSLPRAGLTHSAAEFLGPEAWKQSWALARLLTTAPPGVRITIKTTSGKPWIQRCVRLANGCSSAFRLLRSSGAGVWR